MALVTRQMLHARLTELLTPPPQLAPADVQTDYSRVDLETIPGNEAFLNEAYQRILGRPPDLDGMRHFLLVLQTHPRQMVIDAMAARAIA